MSANRNPAGTGPDHAVEADTVILGGGLSGLAAASGPGDEAVVLEAQDRPGGLVRTERIGDYWFDHVIHLLYFSHPVVEERVTALLGDVLQPCPPVSWIETSAGDTRFPIQLNLAGLEPAARAACLTDLEAAHERPLPAADYEKLLLNAFGRSLCELFFFPYNRKLWRRPPSELSASGFHWNLTRPSVADVVRGADPGREVAQGYNSRGWYPRPAGPGRRGMEVLSQALAAQVPGLRLRHTVEGIDPLSRTVTARTPQGTARFRYVRDCVSTLPLPVTVALCSTAPADLVERCAALPRNRVRSVALAVRGPRPAGTGHWRYYTREDVPFTRLVFMTEFDPGMAPPDGWGLLAEVVERAEEAPCSDSALIEQVITGVRAVGLLSEADELVATRVLTCDPGYVVFTPESRAVTQEATAFLAREGVTALGRYGTWTYSSMSQVMESAFAWAANR
ncbi:protoporphyrinogen/coproporphyrinogen oxidase [Streptomyces sp. NBC_00859]|uniref:protoporphyrinogen/coproporphyrinogen oxidase n=1 Tax=Streptomyces sp. NBC_00859 TaxID=2903682 RepID=UPI003867CB35|nr:FAD-dependent oxidoreductase [Streptomyces sp. NBC_00859]WSZ86717.1 FAD-dependent oxidoreductase [Streptomyces sp. NBC_00859]